LDSTTITEKLRETFNVNELGNALFYSWRWSLRFELNSGGSYVEMFTSSYDRVRTLMQETFNSSRIYVLIAFNCEISSDTIQARQIQDLEECGFKLPKKYILEQHIHEDKDDSEFSFKELNFLFPIEIGDTNYKALLWAVCAKDLGIQPRALINAYFIDFERQIIAYPYDDRGMDIVALNKQSLSCLYQKYYDWLLDYDLEEMKTKFNEH